MIRPMKVRRKHPAESWTEQERHATFDREEKVMKMFSDNARTYIQLSGAALALTLTFAHEILHVPKEQNIVDAWMVLMWVCFLLAILAGAFYQYLAVKFLEGCLDWAHSNVWSWVEAGNVYGIMLLAFYGGTIIFTGYAVIRLWHR